MTEPSGETIVPRGLPAPLPAGERILWQGGPDAKALARDALHSRLIVAYFAAVAIFVAGIAWSEGRPAVKTMISLALIGVACLAVLGLIRGYAILMARSAVYTITTQRVVMKVGVALPVTINIPHAIIQDAGLRTDRDGTGDIPLGLSGMGRMGYVHLWPHARPWHIVRPQPMLRGVRDAGQAAAILACALRATPLAQASAARAEAAARPVETALPSAAA